MVEVHDGLKAAYKADFNERLAHIEEISTPTDVETKPAVQEFDAVAARLSVEEQIKAEFLAKIMSKGNALATS